MSKNVLSKNVFAKLILCACLFLALGAGAFAQKKPQKQVVIKLASMVPDNTPWGAALNKMAAEWLAASNGTVKLQVYANGTQGSEDDVLRKLNMNTIQAAVFTSFGLHKICPEIMTISVPFLIRDEGEFNEVLKTLKPDFEKTINSQNYYSMALLHGGWIKFFTRNPISVPADLKKQKVGSLPTEPELAQIFRTMGYQVVMVDANRVLVALNGGSIDAVYESPIAAAGFQHFGIAKNMASINICPFMGGLVLSKKAWDAVPAEYKPELQRITKKFEIDMQAALLKLEADATAEMKKHGLVVTEVNAQQAQAWYDDMTKATPSLLGTTFDKATYQKIEAILKAYRGK
jgi:TRAP-type C4-dicarboxylate transport system substrate-binding protein